MFMFAALAALQFAVPADVVELPQGQSGRAGFGELAARPSGLLRLGMRYPLLILVSLNALTLTILYGIAEFLFLSVYSEHFPDEQELTRFLGMVFALLQACEFLLLVCFSRTLLERTSPLVRNLVFPLTSLGCLLYLAFSGKLSAAVITHVNAEAASNAVFQPVHNANFLALPLGIQGRARTLSEGIFYPAGLAIAGALLLGMDKAGAIAAANFVAVLFALVFILLNVGVGLLFLTTLIASLRSGAVSLADLTGRIIGLPAAATDRVREFLRSPLPERRLDGIALSRWLGPAHVADDLVALASHSDLPTRRALVRLAIEAGGAWVRPFIDAAYDRSDRSSTVAMQVMLAHREALSAGQVEQLARSGDPSRVALAPLLVDGFDPKLALASLTPVLRHPKVAADVIEGIVGADRADCAGIVLAALPTAPPDQQRLGLQFLRRSRMHVVASSWRSLRHFTRHHDLGVRTEVMAFLGECQHRTALRALHRGLTDWSPRVRRRAADALAAQGDAAVDLLREHLVPTTLGSAEAARALSRMTSRHARQGLLKSLRQLRRDARENARLLGCFAVAPEPGPWLWLVSLRPRSQGSDRRARTLGSQRSTPTSRLRTGALGAQLR